MLSRRRLARSQLRSKLDCEEARAGGALGFEVFNRRSRAQQHTTIPNRKKESLTSPEMVNQPVTIQGTEKQPTTIATATWRLCAATGMNGTTIIGGNNTT